MNKILMLVIMSASVTFVYGEDKQKPLIKYVDPAGQYVHVPYDHNSEKANRQRQYNYSRAVNAQSQYKVIPYDHSKRK